MSSFLWLIVTPWFSVDWRFVQYGIPAALVVYAAVCLEEDFKGVPAGILFWGDASYVLYLIHLPIVQITAKIAARLHTEHVWLAILAGVLLVLGATAAVRAGLEAPLTRWLQKRFDRRPEKSQLNTLQARDDAMHGSV